ncbi:cytochrome P460 family protein [Roseovarius salinarum]|uniref:cytochrome P460 family protein n=1 Tax=Roseovarius salinarum TaxID=1981892 RepID=UPI000C34399D|nr:cytochrome P460 family protein [Roseovarius salinarum]
MKRTLSTAIATLALAGGAALAQDAPFGTETEIGYAADLWGVLEEMNMVGADAVRAFPYEGVAPHGMMLETFYTEATVNGHTGDLLVKRNYGPEGVSKEQVLANPDKHLGAVTVMFRREAGYDADNDNWFWAKYLPDGSLDKNPKGMELAGRVAKGADKGCIACHSGAGDYVFTTDAIGAGME